MSDLLWPGERTAKLLDVTPRRLNQLVAEGIVIRVARNRYDPVKSNVAYIRFLRDRVTSPDMSQSEIYETKLGKMKAEKEQIELETQIKRGSRIPREDVDRMGNMVFKAIAGILKANRNKVLTIEQINEIFDMMRSTLEQLQHDNGNGQVLAA